MIYIPPGKTAADGTSTFLTTPTPPVAIMANGRTTLSRSLEITASAVLEENGVIQATLTRVVLLSCKAGQSAKHVLNQLHFILRTHLMNRTKCKPANDTH